MNTPAVSVIIVTYNCETYIAKCLDALMVSLKSIASEIIVVDNNSADGTRDILHSYGSRVRLIASPDNLGFGGGVNLAYSKSKGEYVWLLNPDAFVDSRCASRMLSHLKKHKTVGIVGAGMKHSDGMAQASFGYTPVFVRELFQLFWVYRLFPIGRVVMPGPFTRHLFLKMHDVAWMSGGCMMIRKTAVSTKKQLFDPRYFMYMEDIDLCRRVAGAGWAIQYLPSAQITHLHSVAFGAGPGRFTHANVLEAQSLLLFWQKWYPNKTGQYAILRTLHKMKLWVKLVLLQPTTANRERRELFWQKWKAL